MNVPLRTLLLAAVLTASSPAIASISSDEALAPARVASVVSNAAESQRLGVPRNLLSSTAAAPIDSAGMTSRDVDGTLAALRQDAWQVVTALAVVVGLLFALRAFLMRSALGLARGGRPSGVLEILARYPIARGQHLIILKLARRILLLHQNGSAMTALTEISNPEEVASLLARIEGGSNSPRDAARFRSLLRQFSHEHERAQSGNPVDHTGGIRDAWDDAREIVDLTKRPRGGIGRILAMASGTFIR